MREQQAGSGNGGAAVGAELGVSAVVEDDVGSESAAVIAVDFLDEFGRNVFCRWIDPVAGHRVPCNGSEIEAARNAQCSGASRAIRRTKKADGLAGDLGEYVGGARELDADAGGGGAREIGMAPCVVADQVASVGDAACESRLGLGESANHEKRGANVVLSECVEEARRPGRVRAVVEGERELAGTERCDEDTAEDLRGRPHGGVGVPARDQPQTGDHADRGRYPCR